MIAVAQEADRNRGAGQSRIRIAPAPIVAREGTVNDAVDIALRHAREGVQMMAACASALHEVRLDMSDLYGLAAVGLHKALQDRLATIKGDSNDEDEGPTGALSSMSVLAPRPAIPVRRTPDMKLSDALARIELAGVDGQLKPVLRFTVSDIRAYEKIAGGQAAAWGSRRVAMARLREALEDAHVATAEELPEDIRKVVAEKIGRAWAK
jgi:hypothetical protein